MFKSDKEVEDLVTHENNIIHKTIGTGNHGNQGREKGGTNSVPNEETRARIGLLADLFGDRVAGEMSGVPRGYATKLRNGQKLNGKPDEALETELISRRGVIQEKALIKAELFLDMLGVGDLNDQVKQSAIAERVVNIYERLMPKTPMINADKAQIIFYAPRIKESTEYPVIEVEAQNG